MSTSEYRIEPLARDHDRSILRCGSEALDRYLREQASQDLRKRAAAPFVMIRAADDRIAGYFTLSSASIPASHLPAETARKLKLPRYPYLPATLLGRLAVDLSFRGLRLGELLLMDALRRALATSSEVASQFVIVDAKDGSTSEFYLRYGFLAFPETSRRLFLPMSTIEALFSPPPAPKSR